jgi:predicted AlkP superfamily pyrophosphatase or phosphodiesterase
MSDLDIYPQLNIIAVSDHGMAEISSDRTVDLSDYADMGAIIQEGSGPYAMLYSEEKGEVEKAVIVLKKVSHISVFLKKEIPDRFHFKNHYRIKEALVLADEGWYIQNQAISSLSEAGKYIPKGGTHGYDNQLRSMHALFIASGPAFKSGIMTPPFENVNIYPLISHILNIDPYPDVDGDLENIIHILNK